jgi:DNA repair protein RecO (recombination protein O)
MRHVDYGEADRIVTLLTPERGLLKGFARAARKSKKRFGGALEPFNRIGVQWRSGRGDLCLLQNAELLDARAGLRTDLQSFALACYGVELVEMLLHEGQAHPEIYQLLYSFLDFLDRHGDPSVARILLELRLVQQLGYIPHLLHCSECFLVFGTQERVAFSTTRGGSLCQSCAGDEALIWLSLGTLGSLSRSLQAPVGLFEGFRFGKTTLQEGEKLLTSVLQKILPRPPKSLQFLQQAMSMANP